MSKKSPSPTMVTFASALESMSRPGGVVTEPAKDIVRGFAARLDAEGETHPNPKYKDASCVFLLKTALEKCDAANKKLKEDKEAAAELERQKKEAALKSIIVLVPEQTETTEEVEAAA